MTDPAAFVRAAVGDIKIGAARPVVDEDMPYFTRTPALRDQLARIAEGLRLLSDIDAGLAECQRYRQRVEAIVRQAIADFNEMQLDLGEEV